MTHPVKRQTLLAENRNACSISRKQLNNYVIRLSTNVGYERTLISLTAHVELQGYLNRLSQLI